MPEYRVIVHVTQKRIHNMKALSWEEAKRRAELLEGATDDWYVDERYTDSEPAHVVRVEFEREYSEDDVEAILVHMLGGSDEEDWYRNFFGSSEDHSDNPLLEVMCYEGLVKKFKPTFPTCEGSIYYTVTDAGKAWLRKRVGGEG